MAYQYVRYATGLEFEPLYSDSVSSGVNLEEAAVCLKLAQTDGKAIYSRIRRRLRRLLALKVPDTV